MLFRSDVGRLYQLCDGSLSVPVTYSLALTISGSKGSVSFAAPGYSTVSCSASCTKAYDAGTSVTLTATPARGYVFRGWSGACTNTSGQCIVALGASTSVTATFSR